MSNTASPGIGQQVTIASLFMIGLRLTFRLLGFVSTLILARLLLPGDFGLVGLASAVFSVLDTLTETSTQMALIRLPALDRDQMDTAWTFGVVRGFLIGGGLALTSGLAADWMNDVRVTPILWVLAATSVVQGFENIGMVMFRRELRFGRIFEYQFYAKLIGVAVTVSCAWVFQSYWALVAGIVAMRIFGVVYSYACQPYRPRFSFAAANELFHFSKWLVLNNVLFAIEAYTGRLLFARLGGAAAVGLYEVSWQVGSLPVGEIAAPIREPIYAGYAKLLGDVAELRRYFSASMAFVMMVICPMSIGLALTADLASALMLGPKWTAAVPLIRLCAIYALLDSIGHFTHNIYIVLNRQRRLVMTSAPIVVIRFAIAIWAGFHGGMIAAVWVLTLTAAVNAVIWICCLFPLIHLSVGELVRPNWRTLAASAVMVVVVMLGCDLTAGSASIMTLLGRSLTAIAVGGVAQISIQWLLWRLCGSPAGPEARMMSLVRGQIAGLTAISMRYRRGHV